MELLANPLKDLDYALEFIGKNHEPYMPERYFEAVTGMDRKWPSGYTTAIFRKLLIDGYVSDNKELLGKHYIYNGVRVREVPGDVYFLTFEGLLFLQKGGYKAAYILDKSEIRKLTGQRAAELRDGKRIAVLTFWLVVVGVVPAVYYILEVLNSFLGIFHKCSR